MPNHTQPEKLTLILTLFLQSLGVENGRLILEENWFAEKIAVIILIKALIPVSQHWDSVEESAWTWSVAHECQLRPHAGEVGTV